MSAKIPTYFSHSYRLRDQNLNKELWSVFAKHGFFFSVDPPSNITVHAHLERMMRQNSCFVAVVNRRNEEAEVFCSRFVLYEMGLSLQARLPRLLLIDGEIGSSVFDSLSSEEKVFFSRGSDGHAQYDRRELERKVLRLKARAEPLTSHTGKQRGPIGLLVPETKRSAAYGGASVRRKVGEVARLHGFVCEEIPAPSRDNASFAIALDRCEAVVLDVRGDKTLPPWVFAYIHGRLVPSIKLVRLMEGELASDVELPPVVKRLRMDPDEPTVESVTYWRDSSDLIHQLDRAFDKLDEHATELRRPKEGLRYFDSIGRQPARVFISNAGANNDTAARLSRHLRLNNIERFQYKDRDAIPTGSNWQAQILHELRACQVFVALIGPTYRGSEWCRREFEIAQQRAKSEELVILPYRLGAADVRFAGKLQAPDLPARAAGTRKIMKDIDRALKSARRSKTQRQPYLLGGSRELLVDALRHMPAGAWKKLHGQLRVAGVDIAPARSKKVQARGVAEEVLFAAERATLTETAARQSPSAVAYLMEQLTILAPNRYRKVLSKISKRHRRGARKIESI
ncbi:MAG: toll/interleukin-1 receptor domain-containing protein [Myxococcota bacterium]